MEKKGKNGIGRRFIVVIATGLGELRVCTHVCLGKDGVAYGAFLVKNWSNNGREEEGE